MALARSACLLRLVWTSLFLALALLLAPSARGAGTVGDGTPASCTETAFAAALAGGGDVGFACGAAPVAIPVTQRHWVAADARIDGGGRVALDGAGRFPVLGVRAGATLRLRGLTIARGGWEAGAVFVEEAATLETEDVDFVENVRSGIYNTGRAVVRGGSFRGNTSNGAGGIYHARGTLLVEGAEFRDNDAAIRAEAAAEIRGALFEDNQNTFDGGGAIYSSAPLTVADSTFRRNQGRGAGGAIFCWRELEVVRSLFESNRAVYYSGGAIGCYNNVNDPGSRVDVRDSVFAGNRAPQTGGALYAHGPQTAVSYENVTVIGNEAPRASGIFHEGLSGELRHVTLAGDDLEAATGGLVVANSLLVDARCEGAFADGGGNLQFPADVCSAALPDAASDPGLSALADHGGPTPTLALPEDSVARGAGLAASCPPGDQRGARRPAGEPCDAGAFERGAVPVVASLTPASAKVGSPDLALAVHGAGFLDQSVVLFDGSPLATRFESASVLRAVIPAARLAQAGTAAVRVETPVADGGVSAESLPFEIGSGPAQGVCGDGELDPGEACDDGNEVAGDGCENDCTPTAPGPGACDGLVDIARARCELARAKQPGWACGDEVLAPKLAKALGKAVDAADAKLAKAAQKERKRSGLAAAAARKLGKLERKAATKLGGAQSEACRLDLADALVALRAEVEALF